MAERTSEVMELKRDLAQALKDKERLQEVGLEAWSISLINWLTVRVVIVSFLLVFPFRFDFLRFRQSEFVSRTCFVGFFAVLRVLLFYLSLVFIGFSISFNFSFILHFGGVQEEKYTVMKWSKLYFFNGRTVILKSTCFYMTLNEGWNRNKFLQ